MSQLQVQPTKSDTCLIHLKTGIKEPPYSRSCKVQFSK